MIRSAELPHSPFYPTTLIELLRHRASRCAERRVFTFLADGKTEEGHLTFGELDRRARSLGALLQQVEEPQARALLLYPSGLDYIAAFFGCIFAGAVAVPVYPPRQNRTLYRLQSIVKDSRATTALTTARAFARIEPLLTQFPELARLRWITTDAIDEGLAEQWRPPQVGSDSLAFLQYTSGSTSSPKGVMVSHGNLLHNQRLIEEACGHTDQSTFVSWLPIYHDMGLIGTILQPVYLGALGVLIPPEHFLQDPFCWLSAISKYRAHTSGGPNFAYDLCIRKISSEQRESLDLSSWQIAFDGSEPVRWSTLERFAAVFKQSRFSPKAFYPCYGLAEATLFVSGGIKDVRPPVLRVQSAALRHGRAIAADSGDKNTHTIVSCGRAWLDQQVAIVDPEQMVVCKAGRVGEIWVKGPSVAQGYWNQSEETERVFGARLSYTNEGPFLRTGDLGFMRRGELFVTGRMKDLIIIRGQNHYPQDIELTVERSHPALRSGCGAAFSVEVNGQEQLVVVQEIEKPSPNLKGDEMLAAIRRKVAEEHELQAQAVVLIQPGSIPKTSSGKIQRGSCRERFLAGDLAVVRRSDLPDSTKVDDEQHPIGRIELAQGWEEALSQIGSYLHQRVSGILKIDAARLDRALALTALGLDSLAAIQLKDRIEIDLGASISVASLFEGIDIEQLAMQVLIARDSARRSETIPRVTAGEAFNQYPLSPGQRSIWFMQQLAPESIAYNLSRAVRIREELDLPALRRAFQNLIDRHSSLRTTFTADNGEPSQYVHAARDVSVAHEDGSVFDEEAFNERLNDEANRPFDLEQGPLFRVFVFSRSGREHVLLIMVHHLVADFWSLAVMVEELAMLYAAEQAGTTAERPPLDLEYRDYVRWQEELLGGAEGERLRSYWREELSGELPGLNLQTDRPRPPSQTYNGATIHFAIDAGTTGGLRELGRIQGATLFMILLAAYELLLCRHTGQKEILIGSPTTGRNRRELAGLVGYFVNPVVMRARLAGNPSFTGLLSQTRKTVLSAFDNQDLPFAKVVEMLQPDREPGRSPLFQAMFALQKVPVLADQPLGAFALGCEGVTIELGQLRLESVKLEQATTQFDLTLTMAEIGSELGASLEFNTDVFDRETVAGMVTHFEILLKAITIDSGQRIGYIPLLTSDERIQLLLEWNDTRTIYPEQICLHDLIERQAALTPDSVGVIFEGEHLTYCELDAAANQLAYHLRSLGVGPESRVGICLERSLEMVVSLLAVLKSGGAYVPLDPAYPKQRLAFMLQDARAEVVLTQSNLGDRLSPQEARVVCLDTDRANIVLRSRDSLTRETTAANLAYVIYTSGTTGTPKGAMIHHGGICNRLLWMQHEYRLQDHDRVLQKTPMSFDVSVWEYFWPLIAGATMVVARPAGHQDSHYLVEVIRREAVSVLHFVPSMLSVMLEEDGLQQLESVRLVICSGEELGAEEVERFYTRFDAELNNLYGPTETSVDVTYWRCKRGTRKVPIGKPIANTRIHILDAEKGLAGAGVAGEIYIAGEGVGRGYLGQTALTAEKYLPDEYGEAGSRIYRTGDLGRRNRVGEIEYLGRADHQLKIRGFRIEPGEVESVLRQHQNVRDAFVAVHERAPANQQLVGYIVFRQGADASTRELEAFAREGLPEYMVPSAFMALGEFPLTPNGKIDRNALPAPDFDSRKADETPNGAGTPAEEIIAGIWANVLHIDAVGVRDNFFELGGHSLLATRVVSRLRQLFNVDLPVRALFESPTVAGLALRLQKTDQLAKPRPILPARRDSYLPLSFAQRRLWFIEQLEPGDPAYLMPAAVRLRGELNLHALNQSLTEILRRHESLRSAFQMSHGDPLQIVELPRTISMPLGDLRALANDEREAEVTHLSFVGARRPFELSVGPLLRLTLLRVNDDDFVLLFTIHHILMDGWSLGLFVDELAKLYDGFSNGSPSSLSELRVQYADYIYWQRELLQGEILAQLLGYWRDQLAELPPLRMPTDRTRPRLLASNGGNLSSVAPVALLDSLKALSRRQEASLFMTLLAAFKILLHRYTSQEDIVVGTDIASRNQAEIESLIGFFVNHLVLRTDLSGNPTFADLLARVREVTLSAYAHQDLPFDLLVEDLQPERARQRTPLFEVLFVLQNAPMPALELGGLSLHEMEIENGTTKYDLVLILRETADGLSVIWRFNWDLFNRETIETMSERFITLLGSIVSDPTARLDRLQALTRAERDQIEMEKMERRESALSRLRNVKRKAIDLLGDALVKTENMQPDWELPLMIRPTLTDVDLADWARNNQEFVSGKLLKHGALLFRGFPLKSAADFEEAATAMCPTLHGDYGDLPREDVGGHIYSSTPYPADQTILFHNESSHMHWWPLKQFFFCLKAPEQAGETPLVDCREVYKRLSPSIRLKIAQRKLLYVRNFSDGLDISWPVFFHTSDRSAVEKYCGEAGIEVEWRQGDALRTRQVRPGVAVHPGTGESVFFNQIQAHHISCVEPKTRESLLSIFGEQQLPRNVYYGDGEPIEWPEVQEICRVYSDLAVSFPWQEGDLLMLDNMLTAHGRYPYKGQRKILVAMGEMMCEEDLNASVRSSSLRIDEPEGTEASDGRG